MVVIWDEMVTVVDSSSQIISNENDNGGGMSAVGYWGIFWAIP